MATRLRVPRSVRGIVAVLVVAAIVEYLVLPQLATARGSAGTLRDVSPWLLAIGVGLEAAALAAYFQLTRSLLPGTTRPSFLRMARIELSTLGLSHVVPGGAGPAGALGYRLLTEAGVRPADATFALATQGIGSALVLNLIFWLALVVSIPARGIQPLYTTAALLGIALFALFAVLLLWLTRGETRTAGTICRVAGRLPFVDAAKVEGGVHRVAARVRELAGQPALVVRAVGWAAANWLLDAGSLWVFLAAFGHRTDVDALLVAYCLANVLGALPVTPGGLGIVEGVLTPTLIGFGVPGATAVLGVVAWRLVNFWAPIPAGGVAYLSLRLGPGEGRGRRAAELERVVEEAARQAQVRSGEADEH